MKDDQGNKSIGNNCTECQFEPENGHAHNCPKAQVCVKCGCTDARACPGGCFWIHKNICSMHYGEKYE